MKTIKLLLFIVFVLAMNNASAKTWFSCTNSGQGYTFIEDANGNLCCWKPAGGCPPGAPFVFEAKPGAYDKLSDPETDDDITIHLRDNLDVMAAAPSQAIIDELTANLAAATEGGAVPPVIYVATDEFTVDQLNYMQQ